MTEDDDDTIWQGAAGTVAIAQMSDSYLRNVERFLARKGDVHNGIYAECVARGIELSTISDRSSGGYGPRDEEF